MITKEQATDMRPFWREDTIESANRAGRAIVPAHTEFHYTGRHECKRETGPRGGVTETITRVRRSGATQTWKRDPARFRVPVKYGLYESFEITERNAADFHLPEDCPLTR